MPSDKSIASGDEYQEDSAYGLYPFGGLLSGSSPKLLLPSTYRPHIPDRIARGPGSCDFRFARHLWKLDRAYLEMCDYLREHRRLLGADMAYTLHPGGSIIE